MFNFFHLFPIQRKSETKGRRPLRKNNLNGHCPDRNQVLIDDNDDDDNGDNFDDYGDENDQKPTNTMPFKSKYTPFRHNYTGPLLIFVLNFLCTTRRRKNKTKN